MEQKPIRVVYFGNGETVYNKYGIFEHDNPVILSSIDGKEVLANYQGFREKVQAEKVQKKEAKAE